MKNFICVLLTFFLVSVAAQSQTVVTDFVDEPESLHYYFVAIFGANADESSTLTEVKEKLSNYHQTNYSHTSLRVSNLYLGTPSDKIPVIVIRRFEHESLATDYHKKFAGKIKDFFPNDWKIRSYPISQMNYRMTLQLKSIEPYADFYKDKF